MATGIALLPGVVFLLAAVIAWRSSRRYATLLGAAGLSWFAGDVLDPLLLVHRPMMIYAVLAYPVGRLRGRFDWIVVMVALAGAVFVPLGRSVPGMVGLASVLILESVRLWSARARGHTSAAMVTARATTALAVGLALPALVRWLWPTSLVGRSSFLLYCVLLTLAGLIIVVGLHRRSRSWETDAVIELSDETPELTMTSLRTAAATEDDPDARRSLLSAAALLESNATLQAQLAERAAAVRTSRAELVQAGIAERRRLEGLLASGAMGRLDELEQALVDLDRVGDQGVAASVPGCLAEVQKTREDLQQLARGLHPRLLTERGLEAAFAELADSCPLPIQLDVTERRFAPQAEVAIWYACAEAITNAVKHSGARRIVVSVRERAGDLVAEVDDDGIGGADITAGGGLAGLIDRLEAIGGRLSLSSSPGRGTRLTMWVPIP